MRLVYSLFIAVAFLLQVSIVKADEDNPENKEKTCQVSGNVFDEHTGESLTGVKVTIIETGETTYTDFNGNYNFDKVKPGTYSINVSYVAYNKITVSNIELNPENSTVLDFRLHLFSE